MASPPTGREGVDDRLPPQRRRLTGALNRSSLAVRTRDFIAEGQRAGEPVSLVLCDVDHFKCINDDHGHVTGDVVLREVAYALRKGVRTFDPVYRYGGEEFVILLPGLGLNEAPRSQSGCARRSPSCTRLT